MVKDEQIKYIISEFPGSTGDNTEFCLKFWELACKQNGLEFPEYLKAVIREYKPEAITRKRRKFVESSKYQRAKETEYFNEYART